MTLKIVTIIMTIFAVVFAALMVIGWAQYDALYQQYKDINAQLDEMTEQAITEHGNALYYYDLATKGVDHENI